MRSIVRDIAEKLGTIATCVAIIRVASGPFKIEDAATLDEILSNENAGFVKINKVLKLPEIMLESAEAKNLFSGKSIDKKVPNGDYLTFLGEDEFSLATAINGKLKNKIYLYEKENIW